MIVIVVLDHNMCMLIVWQWLGLQRVGQINAPLGSYSRDHINRSVFVNGVIGCCGASEATRVSKVANAHTSRFGGWSLFARAWGGLGKL